MNAPALELDAVSRRFGPRIALDGVSLALGEDELLVVLGPTGAGKTTLLRVVAGLEAPDGGAIRMRGADVTGESPPARDVALVFQNFSLYPGWTVRDNLAFPLRAPGRGMSEVAVAERVRWAAELLRIAPLLDRPSERLSGGEMQRVAIGRAIVRRPSLFLFDEPLTNLDAKLREALRVELVSLRRRLRTPMVYVTHDQAEALSMADRLIVLDRGRLLQAGSPEAVYRTPASPAVARQLGQPAINLIPVRRRAGAWTGPSGAPLMPAAEDGPAERLLAVRPEHVAAEGGPGPALVQAVEFLGAFKVVRLAWAGHVVRAQVPAAAAVKAGDAWRPRIDPARSLLFPAVGADAPSAGKPGVESGISGR